MNKKSIFKLIIDYKMTMELKYTYKKHTFNFLMK